MIYMDDLEFVGPNDSNRVLPYTGSYFVTDEARESGDPVSYDAKVPTPHPSHPNSVRIDIHLKNGYMNLITKTCSPKKAMAHIIAYKEFVLNKGCDNRTQSQIEIEIQSKVNSLLKEGT